MDILPNSDPFVYRVQKRKQINIRTHCHVMHEPYLHRSAGLVYFLLNDRITASHTVNAAAFVGKARNATGTTPYDVGDISNDPLA